MSRRVYLGGLTVNGIYIKRIIIDPHYEEHHANSINDSLIINLVRTLHGEFHMPVDQECSYRYFVKDHIPCDGKHYKLVWLMEEKEFYVGVINAYRR